MVVCDWRCPRKQETTMMLAPYATPEERSSNTCAAFVRFEMHERKGPRGGRATTVTAECARCHYITEELKTERPGSGEAEAVVLRARLSKRTCPNAYIEEEPTALLRELYDAVTNRERLGLHFAVKHLREQESVADAAVRAWKLCTHGLVMGRFIRLGSGGFTMEMESDDGRTVEIHPVVLECETTIRGKPETVAALLRRMVSIEEVQRVARYAERKAMPLRVVRET
jgi:hypothetical protein